MKNQVTRLVTIGIALAAAVAVHAQDKTITANVPFSFYMGSSLMPQGAYRVNESSHGSIVSISSTVSTAAKAATAHCLVGKKESEPARLVFHRYGDNYFLAEIWTGDTPEGQALAPSPLEKEFAHSGLGTRLAMVQVYLNR